MVLRVYADESEMTESGTRILTVGALLNNPPGWELFDRAWKGVLEEYDVEVFHTTDYEAGQGPYRGWPKEKKIAFMQALMQAVTAAKPIISAVSTSVILNDWDALSEVEKRKLGTAYNVCAMWSVLTISANLGRAKVKDLIAYVFEERQRQGRVVQAFEEVKRHPIAGKEKRFESISTVRKEAFVALQLADLWAFEATKSALRETGAHSRPPRQSYLAMKQRMYLQETPLYDAARLRGLIAALDAGAADPRQYQR